MAEQKDAMESLRRRRRTASPPPAPSSTDNLRRLLPRFLNSASDARIKTSQSALTLDELDRQQQKMTFSSSRLKRISKLPRLGELQQQVGKHIEDAKGRYELHEKLLFQFYSRRSASLERGKRFWLTDPLAKWRMWWRSLGVMMMLFHAVCAAASSWVAYRCAADPLCNLNTRDCPDLWTWAAMPFDKLVVLPLGLGCRRDLVVKISATAVRAFSAIEIILGVGTGLAMFNPFHIEPTKPMAPFATGPRAKASPLVDKPQTWAYGTSSGALGRALLLLDVVLLLGPDVRAVPQLLPVHLPLTAWAQAAHIGSGYDAGAARRIDGSHADAGRVDANRGERARWSVGDAWWTSAPQTTGEDAWWSNFCNRQHWCRENNLVRTVTGYQRLVALSPAPAPIQYVIDRTIEYMLPDQG